MNTAVDIESKSLPAHVSVCQERYKNLDKRLTSIENEVKNVYDEISKGNKSLTKVIIGSAGTVIAGLLSTLVVLLINFNGV